MEFQEFIKLKNRMCEKNERCKTCGLYTIGGNADTCACNIFRHPKEAEEVVTKWNKEHPVKTNADKFKEVFGRNILFSNEYPGYFMIQDVTVFSANAKELTIDWWEAEYKEEN